MADVFLAKFQLRPEEVQILRGTRDGILHPVCHCLYLLTVVILALFEAHVVMFMSRIQCVNLVN